MENPTYKELREVVEETGYHCRVVSVVGIFDSRLCGTTYPLHLYHFTFLCSPLDEEKQIVPTHKEESLNIEWFQEKNLPENIDLGHISRIPEAYRVWRGDSRAFFDQ